MVRQYGIMASTLDFEHLDISDLKRLGKLIDFLIAKNEVAPGRFELPSQDPESRMIDRYTTGLIRCRTTIEMVDKTNPRLIL